MLRIESRHVKQLNPHQLADVVRMLVQMEINQQRLTDVNYSIPSDIFTPDGGEDGFIDLNENDCFNRRFGSSKAFFQLKSNDTFQKAEFVKDLYTSAEKPTLKPMIEKRIKDGFTFVWFVTGVNQTTNEQNKIIDKIQVEIGNFPNMPETIPVCIYDSEKIAGWINEYSGAIQNTFSILKQRSEYYNDLLTWRDLVEKAEYSGEYYWNDRLNEMKNSICQFVLDKTNNHLRIKGKSGLGKTKLLIESLRQVTPNSFSVKENVLYVDKFSLDKAQNLCNEVIRSGSKNAIMVFDNFSLNDHSQLTRLVNVIPGSSSPQIKVISIDFDDSTQSNTISEIELRCEDLKSTIPCFLKRFIDQQTVTEDQAKQIEYFCDGYPVLARMIANQIRANSGSIGEIDADNNHLIDLLVFGRNRDSENKDHVLKTIGFISLFSFLTLNKDTKEPIIQWINSLFNIGDDDGHPFLNRLEHDRILDRFENQVQVRPLPLAKTLAGRLLAGVTPKKSQAIITLIEENGLTDQFVQMFRYYSEAPWASEWVQKTIGYWQTKPLGLQNPVNFGQTQQILSDKGSQLLGAFALANPIAVMDILYPTIESLSQNEIKSISQRARRNLVSSLDRLSFKNETFEKAIHVLFKLAVSETEGYSNNSTGILKSKFAWSNAGTEVDYLTRIKALQQIELKTNAEKLIWGECLIQSMNMHNMRVVHAEVQSAVKEDPIFQPKLLSEVFEYWAWCNDHLIDLIEGDSTIASDLYSKQCHHVRTMINYRQYNCVDALVNCWIRHTDVLDISGLLEQINHFVKYDLKDIIKDRIKKEARPKINTLLKKIKHWKDSASSSVENELATYLLGNVQLWVEGENFIDALPNKINALVAQLAAQSERDKIIALGKNVFDIKYKRAYDFGAAIASVDKNICETILSFGLKKIAGTLDHSLFNYGVIFGALSASNSLINPPEWKSKFVQALRGGIPQFIPFFFCRTKLDETDLKDIESLFEQGLVEPNSIQCLAYGSVLTSIPTQALIEFLNRIYVLNPKSAIVLAEIYHMVLFNAPSERVQPVLKNLGDSILHNQFFMNAISTGPELPYEFGRIIRGAGIGQPQPKFAEVILYDFFRMLNTHVINSFRFQHGLMSVLDDYIIPDYPQILLNKILEQFRGDEPQPCYFELNQILGVHQGNFGLDPNRITKIDVNLVLETYQNATNKYLCDFLGHCLPIYSISEHADSQKQSEKSLSNHEFSVKMLSHDWPDEFYEGLSTNCFSYGWSGNTSKYYEAMINSLKNIQSSLEAKYEKSHTNIIRLLSQMQECFEQEIKKEQAQKWLYRN